MGLDLDEAAGGVPDTGKEEVFVSTTVNGRPWEGFVPVYETLVEFLRDRLGLTGTKLVCDMEVCGACTVLLDDIPVSACTTLALEARGRRITTVEGLAGLDGGLDPLQQAFIEYGGFQCGFCTAGMLVSARALLKHEPQADDETIKRWMAGNICRCTGYHKILEAIKAAAGSCARPGKGGDR